MPLNSRLPFNSINPVKTSKIMIKLNFTTLFTLSLSILSCLLLGCEDPQRIDMIIKAGHLFDAKTGSVAKDRVLFINDGKILSIGSKDDLKQYEAVQVIEASDHFVMPALFDTHCHITPFIDSIMLVDGVPSISVFPDKELSKWHLKMMLYQGITNARDLGGFPELTVSLRNEERAHKIQSPRIQAGSKLMSEKPLIFPAIVEEIKSEEEARAYIRKMDSVGVDLIKLLFNLRPEFSKAAIQEAHRLGLTVVGHIHTTTWQEAIDMGIDALVHAPYGNEPMMDLSSSHVDHILKLMADEKIPNDPTLAMRYEYFQDPQFEQKTQQEEVYQSAPERLKKMWRMLADYKQGAFKASPEIAKYHSEYVLKAHAAGVILSTSSDTWTSWTDYGNTIHNEMYLLSKAGIPNMDVLQMATRNGAIQLGLEDLFGTLEAGKFADVLILNKNPLEDITHTRSIHALIKDGNLVDRSGLLR